MSAERNDAVAPSRSGPPDAHLIELLAADRNLCLDEVQLDTAWRVQVRHRRELEHLRRVELAYLGAYMEPATALRWIENEGRDR